MALDNQIVLITMSTLIRILNTFVEENTIEDLIIEWQLSGDENIKAIIKTKIKTKVEEVLESDETADAYFFTINYGSEDLTKSLTVGDIIGGKDSIERERISEINLFLNGQKINVELYINNDEWGY